MKKEVNEIVWDQYVTIYNRVVLKQLGLAFGIPFGGITLFILINYLVDRAKGYYTSIDGLQYALIMIGIWLALSALFIFVIYRNRFLMHYEINDDGIYMGFAPQDRKKNKAVNFAAIIAGGLAGKPGIVGAGLLAESNQGTLLRWEKCTQFRSNPRKHRITVYNKFIEFMIIECNSENYQIVLDEIRQRVPKEYAK